MVVTSCGCRERERERESYTLKKKSAVLFDILTHTQGNLINNKVSMIDALLNIYKTDQLVI